MMCPASDSGIPLPGIPLPGDGIQHMAARLLLKHFCRLAMPSECVFEIQRRAKHETIVIQ